MSSVFVAESDFHQALALLLAQLRISAQLSQGALATELGIDQAAVSRVESGHRRISVGEVFSWLEALGLDSDASAMRLGELWDFHGVRPPGFWNEEHDV